MLIVTNLVVAQWVKDLTAAPEEATHSEAVEVAVLVQLVATATAVLVELASSHQLMALQPITLAVAAVVGVMLAADKMQPCQEMVA